MDAAPRSVLEEEPPARDWSLLPIDVLCSVFAIIGAFDVLMGAGLVCRSWLQAAKVPNVWRTVDMENYDVLLHRDDAVTREMAKAAVDRSHGQLRVFAGKYFVTDDLVEYIVGRSPSLMRLRLVSCCHGYSIVQALVRLSPLVELRSLEFDRVDVTVEEVTAVLENCPLLEFLRVRNCFNVYSSEARDLPAKFARIKTIRLEYDYEFDFY